MTYTLLTVGLVTGFYDNVRSNKCSSTKYNKYLKYLFALCGVLVSPPLAEVNLCSYFGAIPNKVGCLA